MGTPSRKTVTAVLDELRSLPLPEDEPTLAEWRRRHREEDRLRREARARHERLGKTVGLWAAARVRMLLKREGIRTGVNRTGAPFATVHGKDRGVYPRVTLMVYVAAPHTRLGGVRLQFDWSGSTFEELEMWVGSVAAGVAGLVRGISPICGEE